MWFGVPGVDSEVSGFGSGDWVCGSRFRVRVVHLGRSTCQAISSREDWSTRRVYIGRVSTLLNVSLEFRERTERLWDGPSCGELIPGCLFCFCSMFGVSEKLLRRNVKWFRGGLVFKAPEVLYSSTPGSRVKKKKRSLAFRVRC